MNSSSVARRHRRRPGFRLVTFAEVGLPVYSLSLRVITLAHKKVPPIEEFVLRSVAAGMSRQDDISSFLGLQASVVRAALISLAQTENIALAGLPGSRSQSLLITGKGRAAIEKAEVVVPEERSFTLHFDGLLRKVQLLGWAELLQPKELRERGLKEIPAIPVRKPVVSDLKLPDVEQAIRSMGNPGDHRRDLLAIRGIERATRLFRRATVLLYVADHSRELQVGFAIDGKLSEPHERAFAVAGGPKKIGLDKLDLTIPNPREWGELGPTLAEAVTNEERIEALQQELARAEESLQDLLLQMDLGEAAHERLAISERVQQARLLVSEKHRELDRFQVRELSCYDFAPLFEEALQTVKTHLAIVSPSVSAKVVTRELLKRLDELAVAGVSISITIGARDVLQDVRDRAAEEKLKDLAARHICVNVEYTIELSRSILGIDSSFAVVSTFDWLGNPNVSTRQFVAHGGVVIRIPEDVVRILERYKIAKR